MQKNNTQKLLDESERSRKALLSILEDHKRAEEKLNKNRMFIESIINASPDIIYIYDIEERKNVYVNDGIQKNLGYTDQEIKLMGDQVLPTLMHPEDFNYYIQNTYPKYLTVGGKELIIHEYRMRDKNGNWHWLYCKESIYLRKPDGTPKQIFGVTVDITERKRAEKILEESEKRFKLLYEHAPLSYQSLDGNTRLIDVNPAWLATLGYKREEVIGHYFSEFMTLESAELIKERFPKFLAAGEIHDYQFEMVRKDGMHFIVSYDGKIGYDELGHFKQTHCIFQDITERKRAEEALRASEARWKSLVQNAPNLIFTIDQNEKITFINYVLPGFNINQVIGQSVYQFAPSESADTMRKVYERVFATGESETYELIGYGQHGELRWYSSRVGALKKEGEVVSLLVITSDISERKHAEEMVRQSEEKYRSLVETMTEGLLQVDNNDIILYANRRLCEMFGYRPEELIGKVGYELLADEEEQKIIIEKNNLRMQEISDSYEIKQKRKSGEYIWVRVSA